VAFTRFNLFLRDEFRCQYCGAKGDLTFDHVVPRGRRRDQLAERGGGLFALQPQEGVEVAAHRAGMSLRKPPRQPQAEELRNMGRKFPPNHLHESWMDFLYWDAELEA
jgi:5-methylcytosine-specific restriction endonuclease McrA